MHQVVLRSPGEQVADHLREALHQGALCGEMPGVLRLEKELGVNRNTVESALQILEKEGLLVPQGAGRRRRIEVPASAHAVDALRIGILPYDRETQQRDFILDLQHRLTESGFSAFFTPKALTDLEMSLPRIRRMVRATEADAWVIGAGSREILEWFANRAEPAFALFGRLRGLAIAGTKPDKSPALVAATRELVALGHTRIVKIVHQERRYPEPGRTETTFLEELEAHGISTSACNFPNWTEGPEGYHRCLESLFKATPPTALIAGDVPIMMATQQFLLHRGLRVPQDVSLICTDYDTTFRWCQPSIAHIRWDSGPVVRRIVR